MPPAWAKAMAKLLSVTVSMAAEINGMLRMIFLVKRVEVGAEDVKVVYRVDCGPFELAPSGGHVQDCWRRREPTRAPTQGPRRNGATGRRPLIPEWHKAVNPPSRLAATESDSVLP